MINKSIKFFNRWYKHILLIFRAHGVHFETWFRGLILVFTIDFVTLLATLSTVNYRACYWRVQC